MGRFLFPPQGGRLRAAQIVGNAKLGGVVSSILNYYSHVDRARWRFDFFTYGPSALDEKLKELDPESRVLTIPRLDTQFYKAVPALTKLLREGEYAVAHSHMTTLSVFALRAAHHYAYCYDLAQEWANFTSGLPFVFAAWVACTPAGAAFAPRLNQALAYGVDHIAESITGTVNRSRNFDFDTAYRYLTQSIKFRLDAPKRQAMHLFWEKIISPG